MRLISPEFLQEIEEDFELRNKIIHTLFKENKLIWNASNPKESVFEIVMNSRNISFETSVEWIAKEIMKREVKWASYREVEKMKEMTRQFLFTQKMITKESYDRKHVVEF